MKFGIIKKIKRNRFVRGLHTLYKTYFICSRKKFGYIGDDVTMIPPISFSNPENVYLYGCNILNNASILTVHAKFVMKSHSGAAEGFRVSTGNHAMIKGRFWDTITESEKPEGFDKDVIVESDVWIGRNVTLLSGVTIGRGCTVAACACVTKSMPPYCVIAGIPAKPIKRKWSIDEILQHEAALYPIEERYSRTQLEDIYSKYNI